MKISLKQLKQIIKEEISGRDFKAEIEQEIDTLVNRYVAEGLSPNRVRMMITQACENHHENEMHKYP